ncbi:polynucleotide adenylyltransferase family protein [Striga asiatica]|uniref:Polynucleotide adenylyltransferase family protein n=1 Tax=Striga asiatica TaxID=4170 RepID=A0A5A7P2S2_STRAF|nr:polynucleotide adenylyltransferase family protein [Striga asiatica]
MNQKDEHEHLPCVPIKRLNIKSQSYLQNAIGKLRTFSKKNHNCDGPKLLQVLVSFPLPNRDPPQPAMPPHNSCAHIFSHISPADGKTPSQATGESLSPAELSPLSSSSRMIFLSSVAPKKQMQISITVHPLGPFKLPAVLGTTAKIINLLVLLRKQSFESSMPFLDSSRKSDSNDFCLLPTNLIASFRSRGLQEQFRSISAHSLSTLWGRMDCILGSKLPICSCPTSDILILSKSFFTSAPTEFQYDRTQSFLSSDDAFFLAFPYFLLSPDLWPDPVPESGPLVLLLPLSSSFAK